jgi:hypothetical protein
METTIPPVLTELKEILNILCRILARPGPPKLKMRPDFFEKVDPFRPVPPLIT